MPGAGPRTRAVEVASSHFGYIRRATYRQLSTQREHTVMADQPKQINFTIVPAEDSDAWPTPRIYANFCSIAHTPFDFTLTFCEVMPLSEKEIKAAEADHIVRAPVKTRIVVPVQFVPNLIAALQEHMRVFSDTYSNVGWNKGDPIH